MTELFVCERCNCVDLITLAHADEQFLCSECNPKIGRWHDAFPKVPYRPDVDMVLNRPSPLGISLED